MQTVGKNTYTIASSSADYVFNFIPFSFPEGWVGEAGNDIASRGEGFGFRSWCCEDEGSEANQAEKGSLVKLHFDFVGYGDEKVEDCGEC